MTYACAAWELAADAYHLKSQHLQNKVLRTIGKFPKVHTRPQFVRGSQPSVCVQLYNKIV
jgi:hypothetical protein